MEWIPITTSTKLPKDKKILCYSPEYNSYEVLSYWGMHEGGEDIQIWKTDCGDTFNGTLQWFDEHILPSYTHYLILNEPM